MTIEFARDQKIDKTLFEIHISFPKPKMSVKCPFITNLVPRKVEKENHIRKVRKSEERKVKNIGKKSFCYKDIIVWIGLK